MRKLLLNTILFLAVSICLTSCSSTPKTTKDLGYEKSPCACMGDDIIFNGQVYKAGEISRGV